jgi:hypothetical protein
VEVAVGDVGLVRPEEIVGVAAWLERVEAIHILKAVRHRPTHRQPILRLALLQLIARQEDRDAEEVGVLAQEGRDRRYALVEARVGRGVERRGEHPLVEQH